MPKLVKKEIWWNTIEQAVPGEIVAYHVYYAELGTQFTFDLPHVVVPAPESLVPMRMLLVAPDDFPAGTFPEDVEMSIWITPVDHEGNEPDPLTFSHPFDFVPPSPVVSGGVRDYQG